MTLPRRKLSGLRPASGQGEKCRELHVSGKNGGPDFAKPCQQLCFLELTKPSQRRVPCRLWKTLWISGLGPRDAIRGKGFVGMLDQAMKTVSHSIALFKYQGQHILYK
jgi:hypothetical protein